MMKSVLSWTPSLLIIASLWACSPTGVPGSANVPEASADSTAASTEGSASPEAEEPAQTKFGGVVCDNAGEIVRLHNDLDSANANKRALEAEKQRVSKDDITENERLDAEIRAIDDRIKALEFQLQRQSEAMAECRRMAAQFPGFF